MATTRWKTRISTVFPDIAFFESRKMVDCKLECSHFQIYLVELIDPKFVANMLRCALVLVHILALQQSHAPFPSSFSFCSIF